MIKATRINIVALAFAMAFGGLSNAVAQETASPASAVLDRHLQAFGDRNIDAIMADYSDASVFITPQGVLKGKAQIRGLFEGLVKEFSAPEAKVTVQQRDASGPVAYIIWSAETPSNSYRFATDTIFVENDRIRYQTFAAQVMAK